jgi:hypothetical protein
MSDLEFSQEGVPLEDQESAADAQEDTAVVAVLEAAALSPNEMGEEERLDEDTAVEIGEVIADAVLAPDRAASRLNDGLAWENARRDEAVAQGVEVTTQERLAELAREEEAQAQGVDGIWDTTQKKLFHQARADEAVAGKLEQAQHGTVEPTSIGPGGIDQVAENKRLEKESKELSKV